METNPFLWEIVELSVQLRRERLFVNSQQSYIQELNEKVVAKSSQLAQVSWITSQQRLNLNQLVLSCPNSTPALCCQKAKNLDLTKFLDGQKYLGFQKCATYGELLLTLRDTPELVARCLVAGDKSLPEEMPKVIRSLISGLYASCILTPDKNIVLKVLKNLITLQIIPSESPRRLLQQGSCAFARLYSAFHETLFAAKLYLTAALHDPIMGLLMMEEKYLDIDPEKKVAERFTLEERIKKFGKEGTEEYKTEIKKYKFSILKNLVEVTQSFINSLHENFHCFPNSVFWLVGHIHSSLRKANIIPEKEVFAMCTDLVFTLFICPAIVTPETYGITDIPISDVARYNLMQVAQILQMLAIKKYQKVEGRVEDLYSQFPKDCVSSVVVTMIEGNSNSEEPNHEENIKFEGLPRLLALFTESELHTLVTFLRTLMNESSSDDLKMHKELIPLLSQLPAQIVNGHSKVTNIVPSENSTKKSSILSKVSKNRGQLCNNQSLENGSLDEEEGSSFKVLIIPFDVCSDPSQSFVSEQKILALEKEAENERNERRGDNEPSERQDGQEKRTRFSLSHDDGSIGNTSDNLEVVSEAPSNHSVASSLELETEDQNDNLSDMVSANVSGRGSPNISGRDTPSSQMTEGEDAASVRQPMDFTPPPPPKASSQTKFDINDKFGKFEIDKLIAEVPLDETFSLVSDTWSTDVLASDSETVEQLPVRPLQLVIHELPNNPSLGDAMETASEAWSTDVVISDSDRLTEVDTDDTASVARSDDTGRSEAESRGESEPVEEPVIAQQVVGLRGVNRDEIVVARLDQPTVGNVTGKGGDEADYRRRTIEYVDTNRNLYLKHVVGITEEGDDSGSLRKGSSSVSSPTHSTSEPVNYSNSTLQPPMRSHFRTSQQPSSQELLIEDERSDRESGIISVGCFSASSSTSGSSVEVRHNLAETPPIASPIIVPNGSVSIEGPGSNNRPTGTIPKSISFDKTAERGDKEALDEEGKHKRSFFRNFKLPFKNRRGKSFRTDCYDSGTVGDLEAVASLRLRRGLSEEARTSKIDSSEDILAKYRGKGNSNEAKGKESVSPREGPQPGVPREPVSAYDIFEDAKKKLRLVLSNSEIYQLPESLPMRQAWAQKENELVAFLQLQLAEAINLQDRNLVPQLYETIRCVKMLDARQCQKVFESLKEDYKSRVPYISYFVKCQQSLLATLAHLERLLARVNNDKRVVSDYLVSLCVRLFLEKREAQISDFISEFQVASLNDEKSDLLETFLVSLSTDMERDPNWQGGSMDEVRKVRRAFERSLCSRVYSHAMYPNGDGDISRDEVLQEHIAKLAKVITPDHKDLRIPKAFHCEVPWLSAQAEISELAAYRSPRDKLQCVLRTIATIINLLSLASVPAADDLIPVLVYVIIMANPPSLLSTVEYITSFYGSKIEGEEEYYWTQFCSAIEFIKTMDYVIND